MERSIKNSFAIFRLVFQTDRVSKIGRFVVEKKKRKKVFFNRFISRVLYYYLFMQPRVAIRTENML